jgi:hypothetical protein
MILWVLSGRVVVIMVLHRILKDVKDCEGISKRSNGEDVAKTLYKRGSLHDRKAWAQHLFESHWVPKTMDCISKTDSNGSGKPSRYKHVILRIGVMTSNNVSELSLYLCWVLSETLLSTVVVQVQNIPKDQVKSEFDELHKECHLRKWYCLSEFENDLVGNPTKF